MQSFREIEEHFWLHKKGFLILIIIIILQISGTGDPREKPQGGGVFIWASLKYFEIKTPPQVVYFRYFGLF